MFAKPEDPYRIHRDEGMINRLLRLLGPSEKQTGLPEEYMKLIQTCQDNSRETVL